MYNEVSDNSDAENIILSSMCKCHMGSRWYTSDLQIVTIDIEAYVLTWQQGLYPGVEKNTC
jgi:hypothetical protein